MCWKSMRGGVHPTLTLASNGSPKSLPSTTPCSINSLRRVASLAFSPRTVSVASWNSSTLAFTRRSLPCSSSCGRRPSRARASLLIPSRSSPKTTSLTSVLPTLTPPIAPYGKNPLANCPWCPLTNFGGCTLAGRARNSPLPRRSCPPCVQASRTCSTRPAPDKCPSTSIQSSSRDLVRCAPRRPRCLTCWPPRTFTAFCRPRRRPACSTRRRPVPFWYALASPSRARLPSPTSVSRPGPLCTRSCHTQSRTALRSKKNLATRRLGAPLTR
mmetsp:Transcript_3889/g.12588  ORF Transcript_3889/g.12588 Transcript_3889/m.12588 type:complete len:271 (-) Transcript_3889:1212-2024(-)